MKTCKDCLIEKPIINYYKNPAGADGHQNRCKECSKKAKRESNHRRGVHRGHYKVVASKPPRSGVVEYAQHWTGPPQNNQLAIYVLMADDQVFWVGSTKVPAVRFTNHQQRWGFPFEMVVLRWVSKTDRVVEEGKEMIRQRELGARLLNKIPPRNR